MRNNSVMLFCDGSVNPQQKVGFGAYFILEKDEIQNNLEFIKNRINVNKFENTSSTKLELEALLWALEDEILKGKEIIVYTDCQNILGLEKRREKLERNNYCSSTGKLINNNELYKKFYILIDKLNCSFEKVKGHKKSSLKNDIDILFNFVDKTSRKALREYLANKQ